MKALLREPLVHFMLLGAALFGVYAALNSNRAAPRQDIVVTTGQVENLAAIFAKVWQRPPTAEELKAQVDQYVREEVLSREAIKLGLDQNDTVIRRRLEQKMEFIAEDFAATNEPTVADLADYLTKHQEQFAGEQRFTFRQVFLDPDKHPDRLEADAAALLARLRQRGAAADMSEMGDSFLLPREFTDAAVHDVTSQFGVEFAAGLVKLKTGEWSGPIHSGYGAHLVLVTARTEDRPAVLDEVREQVRRELMNERRLAANARFLDGLLAKYHVTIQQPSSEPALSTNATGVNR